MNETRLGRRGLGLPCMASKEVHEGIRIDDYFRIGDRRKTSKAKFNHENAKGELKPCD